MKPKKELLFRILKYIFEHPECANKDISAALGVPIRSVESRRSALIRKGFPIESPTQLEVVDCQPRRPPSARAERVYLICELLNAESKFTLEQTARFSGLDLTLIETVKHQSVHPQLIIERKRLTVTTLSNQIAHLLRCAQQQALAHQYRITSICH